MRNRICYLMLLVALCFSKYAPCQNRQRGNLTTRETDMDSTRRFRLEDGGYVGVNPIAPGVTIRKPKVLQSQRSTENGDRMQEKGFELENGSDVGVGTEFRTERFQSLGIRRQKATSGGRGETRGDSLPAKRIILQDGGFVGVGTERRKNP